MLRLSSTLSTAIGALAFQVSALMSEFSGGAQSKDVCYRLEASNWAYVDSSYQTRDPRFGSVLPGFSRPKTLVLSTVRANDSTPSFRWKSVPPDSVLLWNTFAMDGFSFRGTIRGDTLNAELRYTHDSFPDRRAELKGTRVACARDKRGMTTAFLAADKT